MGSIGVSELIVIFIIALIVFGPQKLPELGRTIGKALAEFRKHSAELRVAVDQEMRELERHTQELETKAREAVEPPAAPALPPESPVSSVAIDPYHGVPVQPIPTALSSEEQHAVEPAAVPVVLPESPAGAAAMDPYQGAPPQPTPAALSSEEPNTGEKPTDGHSKPA
ncbi:MAG: hypothetical protein DMG28_03090 [Acidobacteria bacterium]|nr:MAG: hypothetical protein DMG28_03090 [Acidobacteriota bacterium]